MQSSFPIWEAVVPRDIEQRQQLNDEKSFPSKQLPQALPTVWKLSNYRERAYSDMVIKPHLKKAIKEMLIQVFKFQIEKSTIRINDECGGLRSFDDLNGGVLHEDWITYCQEMEQLDKEYMEYCNFYHGEEDGQDE